MPWRSVVDAVQRDGVVAHDFPVTSSGTPAKSVLITSSEFGQVESVCGKSDAHIYLSTPKNL